MQASPLLALVVIALVFAVFPPSLSLGLLLSMDGVPDSTARRARVESVEQLDQSALMKRIGMSDPQNDVESQWLDLYESVVARQDALMAAKSQTDFPIREDDAIWTPVAKTERLWKARIWIWLVTQTARPALVSSATANPGLLRPLRDQMRMAAEYESQRSVPVTVTLEDYLYYGAQLPQGALPPVTAQDLEPNGGSGGGGDDYWTANATIARGGQLFRVCVVMPPRTNDQSIIEESELALLDPLAADSERRTVELARKMKANVYVFGPIEPRFTSLRAPQGAGREDADQMIDTVYPWWFASARSNWYAPARTLEGSAAALLDAQVASVSVWDYNRITGGVQYAADEVAPQSILILTTWDDVLVDAPARSSYLRSIQRFVAGWFPVLAGFSVTLLFVTLVASGSAFVYERRLAARERLREEMARMRRDAHDKVYNRLSALSKRVSAAGDSLATESSASIGAIAEDIRGTVGEIQRILGDEAQHTDTGLAQISLADQVRAVCSAQAARLGITVDCKLDEGIPAVPAALGWDLQCIVEEAITNAVRHGHASRVEVRVEAREAGLLRMVVADDGSGTSIRDGSDATEGSTGLIGMAERAARWGGDVRLSPGDEAGTRLVATFRRT